MARGELPPRVGSGTPGLRHSACVAAFGRESPEVRQQLPAPVDEAAREAFDACDVSTFSGHPVSQHS
jgi:hypothetical protein